MSGAGRDQAVVGSHAAARRGGVEVVGAAPATLAVEPRDRDDRSGTDVAVGTVEPASAERATAGPTSVAPVDEAAPRGPVPRLEPVIDLTAAPVIDLTAVVPTAPDVERGLAAHVPASDEVVATARHPRVRSAATSWWGRAFKRALDLVVALPVAALAVVLLPALVVAIRLDSRGPVFFRQQRVGRHGEPIWVVKVRTMHPDAEARLLEDPELFAQYVTNGFKLADRCDPRVTRVGRWLRRTSLDELPQIFCVLRGEMTLVGPRPVLPGELDHLYRDLVPYYLAVKPGLTGVWQVSGRSTVTNRERAEIDAWYVEGWNPLVDLRVLARTPAAVLGATGAC